MRARLAADIETLLRLAVGALEILPLERPVVREPVERLEAQILFRKTIAGAAPMERQPAHRHRHRDDALGLLVFDEVVVPGMFAVVHGALAVPPAVLRVENRSPGFDHGDCDPRAELRELLREHRGCDAAADDADVGFVGHHFICRGANMHHGGWGPTPSRSRSRIRARLGSRLSRPVPSRPTALGLASDDYPLSDRYASGGGRFVVIWIGRHTSRLICAR